MSIREQDIIDIYPRIMAFAFSKTRDKQKAEDLVQTTILKALENKEQWSNVKNLSAWLITICRNKFLDSVKKSTEQQFTDTTDDTKLVSDNLSDNVEDWKIEYKLNLFNQSSSNKFSVFGIQIDNPNWRIKDRTDSMISTNVENLKSSIRELYKNDIELTGQKKDAIIHITDNFLQNRYIYNLLKEYKIVI